MTNKPENLFIELGARIPPNIFKRNIIASSTDDVIEVHRTQYSNTDVFTTILQYEKSDIRNANQQGALYFDFDGETAQEDVKKLLSLLEEQGCLVQNMHLYYSGNKGFHLEIPFNVLGIEPDKELNKIFGNIAKELKEQGDLSSLDTGIYDKVRLWRLPNSINSKSGLFKIPLYVEEIQLSIDEIKEKAKQQRLSFQYKEPVLWKEFSTIYENAKALKLQVIETKEALQLKDTVGLEVGSRDNTMLSLTESLLFRSYNEQEVWDAINLINRTYKPPLDDVSMSRIFRQAVNFATSRKVSATNKNNLRGNEDMPQELRLKNEHATKKNTESVSQETDEYGMPEPILLSELSADLYLVDWIWEGFIARGHVTLLSALWKAGKSTLIKLLLKAIESGKPFVGQQTIPCNVLILTEESKTQWVESRDELDLQSEIYILPNPLKYKLSYVDWVNWLERIKKFCKEKQIGLVIIDTLSEFWSVNDENKATEVTQALMPLNYLKEDNIAVLLVHHFRKSGGTQGTAARGSGALGSKVDIIIDFTRENNEEGTTKRVLQTLSRFEETPSKLIIDYIGIENTYVVIENPDSFLKKEKLTKILKLFQNISSPFSVSDVLNNWDVAQQGKKPSKRTIQRHIATLIKEKYLEKVEEKEIDGKKVPLYRIIDDSQGNDDEKSDNVPNTESQSTHDKEAESIEENNSVAGEEADTNEHIKGSGTQQKPAIYIGQDAIDKLVAFGILEQGQKTCQNPLRTTEKDVWVKSGNGKYEWVKAENVKCNQFLFWQIGDDKPQCSTCNSWYEKHEESKITTWYQTTEPNTEGLQPYLLTYAEKRGEKI